VIVSHGRVDRRQQNVERIAVGLAAVQEDQAAVMFHRRFRNGQAESGSLLMMLDTTDEFELAE